jgi:hypothetical protein
MAKSSTALAKRKPRGQSTALARAADVVEDTLSVDAIMRQVRLVEEVTAKAMKPGEHYGVIPGTEGKDGKAKPTLLKPGAEKLMLLFRLRAEYTPEVTRHASGHVDVSVRCALFHVPTGELRGDGWGSCTTRETKYAYRRAERKCPECGAAFVIKGKPEYDKTGGDGGWLCWKKKGGCGATFVDGDQRVEGQSVGRTPNPDLADCENTVLKMAQKRALVAAILNATAASDAFTQDVEDMASNAEHATQDAAARAHHDEHSTTKPANQNARKRSAKVDDDAKHAARAAQLDEMISECTSPKALEALGNLIGRESLPDAHVRGLRAHYAHRMRKITPPADAGEAWEPEADETGAPPESEDAVVDGEIEGDEAAS